MPTVDNTQVRSLRHAAGQQTSPTFLHQLYPGIVDKQLIDTLGHIIGIGILLEYVPK